MQHSELGDSGVEVSEVGFGAWVVGTDWWGDRSEDDAIEMVRYAVEQGITYFDTGDVYGHGRSEELLGEALSDVRDEVTIATKVGYDFYNNPQAGHGELPKEMDPEYLREGPSTRASSASKSTQSTCSSSTTPTSTRSRRTSSSCWTNSRRTG